MYRRRIQSNLGHRMVPRLDGARNAKQVKARCRDSIANMEGGITMASGMGSLELGDPEDVKRVSLRVAGYRGAIPTASGIPSRKLGDREDIQRASLREREYQRAIVKICRHGVGVSGWINSRR